jgi:uncharacterized protein involved in exopolysaccharide biosynthesis
MKEKALLDYWLIIYRKKWLIICVVLSSMIAAYFISRKITPIYEAKTVFFVPNRQDVISYLTGTEEPVRGPLWPFPSEEKHIPYIGILESKTISMLVHNEFPHKSLKDHQKDIDFVLSNEYMIEVYARDKDPKIAASIANSFVSNFNKLIGEFSVPIWSKNELMVEKEILKAAENLSRAKLDLTKFQEKHNIADLNTETQHLISLKTQFQSKLQNNEIAKIENNSKIGELKRQIESEAKSFSSSGLLIESPQLDMLKIDLAKIETKMTSLRTKGTDNTNELSKLRQKYKRIEEGINNEILITLKQKIKTPGTFYGNIRQNLVNLLVEEQRIQASIQAYKVEIINLEKKIRKIPELKNKTDKFKSEIERYKLILQTLEIKLEETKLQKRRKPQFIIVVDEAKRPEVPSFPIVFINIIAAGIIGIIIGTFYCFFINYLEETKEKRVYNIIRAMEKTERITSVVKKRNY